MSPKRLKSFLVAVFTLSILFGSNVAFSQHQAENGTEVTEKGTTADHEEKMDAAKIIMEHVMDSHEFHFAERGGHPVSIPLPIILYSPQRGLDAFMSSNFEHGAAAYHGYKMVEGKIVAVDEAGNPNESVQVYDLSLTRNVVQMFIAVIILLLVMTSVAKKYTVNGSRKAPTGFQNAVEPVITFVRDEVGKPNLGR